MEGVIGIEPIIKKITWTTPGKFNITLDDGRIIIMPVKLLPGAKKVKPQFRKRAQIINGNMFTWNTCPEVYHIEQVLGKEQDYQYRH
jgi:hypothetical protein